MVELTLKLLKILEYEKEVTFFSILKFCNFNLLFQKPHGVVRLPQRMLHRHFEVYVHAYFLLAQCDRS